MDAFFYLLTPRSHKRVISGWKPIIILKYSPEFYINFSSLFIIVPSMETFEEHSILAKYKEGDNFNHRNTSSISRIEI